MPKIQSKQIKSDLVSAIRRVAGELFTFADEVEQLDDLDKVVSTIKKFPQLIALIKNAIKEMQNNRLDKVELLAEQIANSVERPSVEPVQGVAE